MPLLVRGAKGVAGEIFVDDNNGLGTETILIAEKAAFAQREFGDVDVTGCDAGCQGERRIGGRRRGRGGVRKGIFAFAHRDDVGERGGLDARKAAHALEDIFPSRANLIWISERRGRERESRGENVVHIHTGIE